MSAFSSYILLPTSRPDRLEELDDATLMRLLDSLSNLFHECLKSAEKTFLTSTDDEVKVEPNASDSPQLDGSNAPGEQGMNIFGPFLICLNVSF